MSDSLKSISEDIEQYRWLCKHFNEKVQYKLSQWANVDSTEDCYGKHAEELQKRYDREVRNKINKRSKS